MSQLQLLDPSSERPKRLRVVDDYGAVGSGASGARYVLAENGAEYLIKGPSLNPELPYVAANELIAAALGKLLGLPVLEYAIVQMQGNLFFGSHWMQPGTFYPTTTADLFDRCGNKDRAYDLVVFDTLLCNVDRHEQNLLVRNAKGRSGQPDTHLLLLNDHSHLLMVGRSPPSDLIHQLDSPPGRYVRLDFLTTFVRDEARLVAAIDAVCALPVSRVSALVSAVPDEFLTSAEQATVIDFVLRRRTRLREVFRAGRGAFPALQGGGL